MKKILTRLQSFATFDLPLRNIYIQQAFVTTHENYCKEYQGWSVNATRKKVIAEYCGFPVFFLSIIVAIFSHH
jgi:hypothetical protein